MSKRTRTPHNRIDINTYADLHSFAREFVAGHYELMGVIGDKGLGKSEAFKALLADHPHGLVKGASNPPFQVYQYLYAHRHEPLLFDDADDFYKHPKTRPMLNQLCETDLSGMPRTISYRSREIERLGLPTSFSTTSSVAVICNSWETALDSVADRGLMLHFTPSVYAVHEEVEIGGWFDDKSVLDFLEKHLHLIVEPTLRYYVNAHRMRIAGRDDWQEMTLRMIQPNEHRMDELATLSKLLADDKLSQMEKVTRFKKETGASQATYYRLLKQLRKARGGDEPTTVVPVPPSLSIATQDSPTRKLTGC